MLGDAGESGERRKRCSRPRRVARTSETLKTGARMQTRTHTHTHTPTHTHMHTHRLTHTCLPGLLFSHSEAFVRDWNTGNAKLIPSWLYNPTGQRVGLLQLQGNVLGSHSQAGVPLDEASCQDQGGMLIRHDLVTFLTHSKHEFPVSDILQGGP